MDVSLAGKTALICGSTQGIGLAIARVFAEAGCTCLLLARDEQKLREVVTKLPAATAQLHRFAVADFKDATGVLDAARKLIAGTPVHILVNNTGGPAAGPIAAAKPDDFVNAFAQHLVNNQQLVQLLLPGMKTANYGRIINIISTSVRVPLPNLGVSNTIRGAVASWSKTLANEIAKDNITVNNILPGLTRTGRLENLIAHTASSRNTTKEIVEHEMMESVPMKRFGEAEEIANVACFLASPAASYVNGVSIPVDGGRTGTV